MNAFESFAAAHPYVSHLLVTLVVTYALANLAVWPPPSNPKWRAVWSVMVRTLIKSWNVYGGAWKIPGTMVPEPPPLVEPPTATPPAPPPPPQPKVLPDTLRPPPMPQPKDGPLLPPVEPQ